MRAEPAAATETPAAATGPLSKGPRWLLPAGALLLAAALAAGPARTASPWYHEFHWHGLQLLAGNSFVLAGPRERLVAQVLQTTGIRDKRELPRRRS